MSDEQFHWQYHLLKLPGQQLPYLGAKGFQTLLGFGLLNS
jgi:hypothetical protein